MVLLVLLLRFVLLLIILLLWMLLLMFHLTKKINMNNPILRNIYVCTLTSDKDVRHVRVVASSFGQASANCLRAITLWENKDSYELTRITLSEHVFINLDNFIK